jgi:EAL domain-containing protein (putative c-di-GMP-specific phosphodiesterase class I)
VEALVRWERQPGELVPPAEFIPLAEQIGLIPQITRTVVRLAAAAAAELRHVDLGVPVHVNISARDLVDDDLPEVLAEAMAANGIDGRSIMLEVTETALVDDPVRSRRTLERVRRLGTTVAIDDFGVGYSSLNVLLELPVDQIKLDHSFIIGIEHDRRAQAIVLATVQVARSLGLTVVAEGVETAGSAAWVRAQGVDLLQGYHIERPLPLPALISFLSARASAGRVQAMSDEVTPSEQPPTAAPAGPR